ncbi:MAG: hypothetical protein LBM20_02990 [Rikenellaceae bacterium]|jgi:hypothetical protein|nr:hypothetical protein [Rikenellaceae bacterium]
MSIDLTRPSLFRSILYFGLLYALFCFREYGAAQAFGVGTADAAMAGLMPLGQWLAEWFAVHTVWNEIVSFLLCLLNAFYLTRILARNLIYRERTYIPALIYLIVARGYALSGGTIIGLAVAFLLILAFDNMIQSHGRAHYSGYFLHAGVALGLAPILYAPAVVFLLLLPLGFMLFRQNGRNVVIALLGYLLPIFFASYILWGMGDDFGATLRQLFASLVTSASEGGLPGVIARMGPWDYGLLGLLLLLTVTALVQFGQNRESMRRRALRGNTLLVWMLILAVGMTALPGRSAVVLPIVAVPLAAIIPACFNRRTGWWPNLLYALMIGSIIGYNIYLIW